MTPSTRDKIREALLEARNGRTNQYNIEHALSLLDAKEAPSEDAEALAAAIYKASTLHEGWALIDARDARRDAELVERAIANVTMECRKRWQEEQTWDQLLKVIAVAIRAAARKP
jgi:hypothetical protein